MIVQLLHRDTAHPVLGLPQAEVADALLFYRLALPLPANIVLAFRFLLLRRLHGYVFDRYLA